MGAPAFALEGGPTLSKASDKKVYSYRKIYDEKVEKKERLGDAAPCGPFGCGGPSPPPPPKKRAKNPKLTPPPPPPPPAVAETPAEPAAAAP